MPGLRKPPRSRDWFGHMAASHFAKSGPLSREDDRRHVRIHMSPNPCFEAPDVQELQDLLPAYEVVGFVAKGGMGAVYRAHQRSLDREVAIKILPREFGADEEFRTRFQGEAKAMARLNHPNLIAVYDFGEVDGMPYIVMEFVNGKSLHEAAHGVAIDARESLRLACGICDGLAHAHEAGIIHRDVKPANILLDFKKRPKLGDFGLARAVGTGGKEREIFGTPEYSAPEVTNNPNAVGSRADVYSAGVIFYELLTGGIPGKDYVPVVDALGLDPGFDRIIRRAIHPSAALRYPDAGAMARDLRELESALKKSGARIMTRAAAVPVQMLSPVNPRTTGRIPATPSATAGGPLSRPAPVVMSASSRHRWALWRNFVIILFLLAAIYGMTRLHQWRKDYLTRQQQKANAAQEAQRREAMAETALRGRQRNGNRLTDRTGNKTPPDIPHPERETPLEALSRLRDDLASGAREKFPPGTLERNEHRFLFIENPMAWHQAARFAEIHGGHLATCATTAAQTWLSSKIPAETDVWLGGAATGHDAWGWIDGSEWAGNSPSTAAGRTAILTTRGTIWPKPARLKLPFFIQWHMDGANPGSLEAQLERLQASRDSRQPVWPPGVLVFEDRRYLIIERGLDWDDARTFASSCGAHLAVPSEPAEHLFLKEAVDRSLPKEDAAWLGGRHSENGWEWTTNEPWSFARWAEGAPDGNGNPESAVRIVAGPGGGWDDADPDDPHAARAAIIEWINDPHPERTPPAVAKAAEWAGLRIQVAQLLREKRAKHLEEIVQNGKNLKWDLNVWLRGLRNPEKIAYAKEVGAAKEYVKDDGRIKMPGDPDEVLSLPRRATRIIDHAINRQERLEAEFSAELDQIRRWYIQQLQSRREALVASGLKSPLRALDDEIADCGRNGRAFLDHFEDDL